MKLPFETGRRRRIWLMRHAEAAYIDGAGYCPPQRLSDVDIHRAVRFGELYFRHGVSRKRGAAKVVALDEAEQRVVAALADRIDHRGHLWRDGLDVGLRPAEQRVPLGGRESG